MTTGDEHYREGERLLESLEAYGDSPETQYLARAQVHFTAALAAATIDAAVIAAGDIEVLLKDGGYAGSRLTSHRRDGLGYGR